MGNSKPLRANDKFLYSFIVQRLFSKLKCCYDQNAIFILFWKFL